MYKVHFLVLILMVLISSCSCSNERSGKKSKPETSGRVTVVVFDDLVEHSIFPDEDLIVKGDCISTKNNVKFKIVLGNTEKVAECIDSRFEVVFDSSEVPEGDIVLYPTDDDSEDSSPIEGFTPIEVTKVVCNSNQDFNGTDKCTDRPITSPQVNLNSGVEIDGDVFITSPEVTLDIGASVNAREVLVFENPSSCLEFISEGCKDDRESSECSSINYTSYDVTGSPDFTHEVTGINSGYSANISLLLVNGTEISSCVEYEVKLDSDSPDFSLSSTRTIVNNPVKPPVIQLNNGSVISDIGGSGIDSIEYSIGTNIGGNDVVNYTSIDKNDTQINLTLGSNLLESINYYTTVRATDRVGNSFSTTYGPWTYEACTVNQELISDICSDKTISGSQLVITNAISISDTLFVTDSSLSLSMGSTTNAQKAFVFNNSASCNSHITNNCDTETGSPSCAVIDSTELIPSTSMVYEHTSLANGLEGEVSVYYTNGTQKSSCHSVSVTMDTSGPNLVISIDDNETTSSNESVTLNFDNAPIPDIGGSGVNILEVGIGTNSSSDNIMPYSAISSSATSYTANSLSLEVATDYYFIVRATDNLGNITVVSSSAWRLNLCHPDYQTANPDGSCSNINYSCPIANGIGYQEYDGVSGLSACTVSSCEIGFDANVANTACLPKECSSSSFSMTELANMSLDLSNSNEELTGGNYPNCTLTNASCDSGYGRSFNQKRCVSVVAGISLAVGGAETLFMKNGEVYSSVNIEQATPISEFKTIKPNTKIKDLAIEFGSSCILTFDNELYCSNSSSQQKTLLNPFVNEVSRSSVVLVKMHITGELAGKAIRSVSLGTSHSCVISEEDFVYCWGANDFGQVGNGVISESEYVLEPVRVGAGSSMNGLPIEKLVISGYANYALTKSGRVFTWGASSGISTSGGNIKTSRPLELYQGSGLSGKIITDLTARCVIANGTPYCWGPGIPYDLGRGTTADSYVPVTPTLSGALSGKTAVKAVGSNCVIDTEQDLYCWGRNSEDRFNSSVDLTTPSKIVLDGPATGKKVKDAWVGDNSLMIQTTDNLLYTRGLNWYGNIGRDVPIGQDSAYEWGAVDMTAMEGKTIKRIVFLYENALICALTTEDFAYCWGNKRGNTLGDLEEEFQPTPTPYVYPDNSFENTSVEKIATGSSGKYICIISTDGELYCRGERVGLGLIGGAGVLAKVNRTELPAGKIKDVVIGVDSSSSLNGCLIASDGLPYCWGSPSFLGNNNDTVNYKNRPTPVYTGGVLAGKTVKALSLVQNTACVIASDDLPYCWGAGQNGILGNGLTSGLVPSAVDVSGSLSGKTVKKISVGLQHACVVSSDNKLHCWGSTAYYKLGNGSTSPTAQPRPVAIESGSITGLDILDVVATQNNTCVLASDFNVHCVGGYITSNVNGNETLVNGKVEFGMIDMDGVLAGKTITHIYRTVGKMCASTEDDFIACWGIAGKNGSLGTGTTEQSYNAPQSAVIFNSIP